MREGLVIASYGRHYQVESGDAQYECVTRGRQSDVACGDKVKLKLTSPNQGVIETVMPRTSLLHRSVAHRSKLIAANVDLTVIVVAPVPSYYDLLVNRCLIAAEAAGIEAVICLNKSDLGELADLAYQQLSAYITLGCPVVRVSAHHDVTALLPYLRGKISAFVGQSGMGKSSLINALIPAADSVTGDISVALDSGKHTTTSAKMYQLDATSRLIDSPGMQAFGLNHVKADELDQLFIEFRPYIGHCRFSNCKHTHEPGCAVLTAHQAGKISDTRLAAYQDILKSLIGK
ncbi:ribosome small subunit-dependent GTPase A [Sulfuriferula sp. AH1]|nr:ribosome small subunit-dependent GTPase A [Sulfuriferula sp. AH1]